MCNENAIADEFHILLKCPNVRWRYMYIPNYYIVRPTFFRFAKLLQNTNVHILKKLSVFAKLIMSKFR